MTVGAPERGRWTWNDLPRPLQMLLERTPRNQWYKIRAAVIQSPEAQKIFDLAYDSEQILPRSTLGVRRRVATHEERVRRAQEMIDNLDAFWSAVDQLRAIVERIAQSAGLRPADDATRRMIRPDDAA